jgi:hypothetical protein
MNLELQLALEGLVTPERLDLLLEANRLLSGLGLDVVGDELQEIIEIQNSNADNTMLVSRLDDVLTIGLNQALDSFGVRLIDDATMAQRNNVLHTIASLEHYIIPDHLVGLTMGDFTNEEVIANMTPIFTTLGVEEAIDVLALVSDDLVARIHEVALNAIQLRGPEPVDLLPDNTRRVARLNRLIKGKGAEKCTIVMELANAGVRCGRPLDSLIHQNVEVMDSFDSDHLACELLALVYFSNAPFDEAFTTARRLVQEFTDELSEQNRLNKYLTDLERVVEG